MPILRALVTPVSALAERARLPSSVAVVPGLVAIVDQNPAATNQSTVSGGVWFGGWLVVAFVIIAALIVIGVLLFTGLVRWPLGGPRVVPRPGPPEHGPRMAPGGPATLQPAPRNQGPDAQLGSDPAVPPRPPDRRS